MAAKGLSLVPTDVAVVGAPKVVEKATDIHQEEDRHHSDGVSHHADQKVVAKEIVWRKRVTLISADAAITEIGEEKEKARARARKVQLLLDLVRRAMLRRMWVMSGPLNRHLLRHPKLPELDLPLKEQGRITTHKPLTP